MRILALAAVATVMTACAQASPAERQRLIDTNVALFAPIVEPLAVGAAYGYATRYDYGYADYGYDDRRMPEVRHQEPPPPAVLEKGPTFCRPGIGGRGTICD